MPVIIVGNVTVPDVTGMTLANARAALDAVYLTDSTSLLRTFAYTNGTVISQDPVGGVEIDPSLPVALLLCSRGSRNTRIVRDLDVTRPNTPSGLAGVANSETLITLSWNAASDPQGVPTEANSGVASYQIYQDGAFRVSLPNTSVQMTGLSPFTSYAFQVLSVDGSGNRSVLSSAINVRTLDMTAPSVPVVTATQIDGTSIRATLTTVSSDSGSGL